MTSSGSDLVGASLHPGTATGRLLALAEPVSFWGGVDADGVIVDARHPQHGTALAGRVVAMASGRGSSSASAVLAEQLRSGHAPAAMLLGEPDSVLLLGALVAAELYGVCLPIVVLDTTDLESFPSGGLVSVHAESPPGAATVRCCHGGAP